MIIRKQTKFLSILLAMALFLTSINTTVFASISNEINTNTNETSLTDKLIHVEEERILNLEVIDTITNEVKSTSILFLPGAEWDKNILKGLDKRYVITNYVYDYASEVDITPQVTVGNDGLIKPLAVETIFDIGSFTMSVAEFAIEPTFWNGFWVVADGLSMVFPGIPALSGVKRMVKASSTLEKALEIGVMRYGTLKNKSIPSGWARHHIFEKRFIPALSGATENNMLAIPISKAHHDKITQKMRAKVPYGTNYANMSASAVMTHHINAYKELYDETGDEYWEFLYNFAKGRQYK